MQAMHLRPYLWMLCGCFWFSWMGILAHGLKDTIPWQLVAAARSGLAFLFAIAMAWSLGTRLVWLRPGMLWLRSISGSCSMVTTFYALTHIPVSDVLTLTNTFPLWIALLSWPMGHERPTLTVWLSVICSVAGVAVTQRCDVARFDLAHGSALAASVFTAFAMLGINRLHGIPSLAVVVHFSAVSTLFCLLAYAVFDSFPISEFGTDSGALLRLLGVGATATIGQVFLTKAFRSGSATRVSVVSLTQVIMVMLYEWAVEGRIFDAWQLLGTLMVLAPSGYLMSRARKVEV